MTDTRLTLSGLTQSLALLPFPICLYRSNGSQVFANPAFEQWRPELEADKRLCERWEQLVVHPPESNPTPSIQQPGQRIALFSLPLWIDNQPLLLCTCQLQPAEDQQQTFDKLQPLQSILEHTTEHWAQIRIEPPLQRSWSLERQVQHYIDHAVIDDYRAVNPRHPLYGDLLQHKGKKAAVLYDQDNYRSYVKLAAHHGFKLQLEPIYIVSNAGQEIWQELSCFGTWNNDQLKQVWITERDITELERQKHALSKSENRRRQFFEGNFTPAVRFVLDPPMPIDLPASEQVEWLVQNCIIGDVNQAFCHWSGFSKEQLLGIKLKGSLVDSPTNLELFRYIVAHGFHAKPKEWDVELPDGRQFSFLALHNGVIEKGKLVELWASYQDTTEQKRLMDDLVYQAHHDSLTGLPNRKALLKRLKEQLPDASNAHPLALMFIDLDLFKEVNDALGHQSGDTLLKQLGPRLERCADLHSSDSLVARLGGDEFGVLVPVTDANEAGFLAQRLLEQIKSAFDLGGTSVQISGSIGIALCPHDTVEATDLMRFSDVAMYRAKNDQLGYAHFDPQQDLQSSRRLQLLSELRLAMTQQDQLLLHYQPKIELGSNRVTGVEALLRWQHPEKGFISPGEFIPLVETTDLIHPLTDFVLNQALEDCSSWWHKVQIGVAVNFSMRNLLNPSIIDTIAQALHRHNLPGQALEIEITEHILMSNPQHAHTVLKRLRGLGVGIAIDDFGTGYSSLAYLKKLPVSTLKIDYTFIRDILTDHSDRVIVDSIIDLGSNLDLKVVAEGVESQEILDYLTDRGCNLAQGFHIGRPMPLEEILNWYFAYASPDCCQSFCSTVDPDSPLGRILSNTPLNLTAS